MQISPAMPIASSAICRAVSVTVPRQRPRGGHARYGPPEPTATMPSSGSIRSPVPESRNVDLLVGHDQHRLEPAQQAIGAPVAGQLDRRALEVAAVLFELGLEPREQREGVGGGAGKAGQDRLVVEAPDFLRAVLEHGRAERHLTVAGQHGLVLVADRENRRRVNHCQYSDMPAGPPMPASDVTDTMSMTDAGAARRSLILRFISTGNSVASVGVCDPPWLLIAAGLLTTPVSAQDGSARQRSADSGGSGQAQAAPRTAEPRTTQPRQCATRRLAPGQRA